MSVPTITAIIEESGREISSGECSTNLGESFSLTCHVNSTTDLSRSIITYQWLHDQVKLDESSPSSSSPTLLFQSLKVTDAGEYRCEVTVTSPLLDDLIVARSNAFTLKVQSHSLHCFVQDTDGGKRKFSSKSLSLGPTGLDMTLNLILL